MQEIDVSAFKPNATFQVDASHKSVAASRNGDDGRTGTGRGLDHVVPVSGANAFTHEDSDPPAGPTGVWADTGGSPGGLPSVPERPGSSVGYLVRSKVMLLSQNNIVGTAFD